MLEPNAPIHRLPVEPLGNSILPRAGASMGIAPALAGLGALLPACLAGPLACAGGGGNPPAPPISVTVNSAGSGPLSTAPVAPFTRSFTAAVTNDSSNQGVTWSVLEVGGGSIDAAGTYTAPAAPGTFTVKAASRADANKSGTASVTVVAAPAIDSLSATPSLVFSRQNRAELLPVFHGGTGYLAPAVGAVTSGTAYPVLPTSSTTYTLSVTNAAGSSITADRSVAVETRTPAIASFTADPPVVPWGQSSVLNWTLAGGVPTSLLLNGSLDVLGQNAYRTTPKRRMSWSLGVANPNGGQGPIVVQAVGQGLETFAGSVMGGGGIEDGTGAQARFWGPRGLCFDSAGALWVVDQTAFTLRRILPDGSTATLAGIPGVQGFADGASGQAKFNYAQGIVAAPGGGPLYICDQLNNRIRRFHLGQVSTFAGGTYGFLNGTGPAAQFRDPIGIVMDSAGNLFVCENENHTIRKIAPDASVSTFAGTPGVPAYADGPGATAKFSQPQGLAIDGSDNLYVADAGNSVVRKITPAGNVSTLAGSPGHPGSEDGTGAAARFNALRSLVADAGGNLFVADQSNHTIRAISPAGVVTTLAGKAKVSGFADGAGPEARFYSPWSITRDPAGNLYVGDDGNRVIRRIATDGTVSTFAGTALEYGSADGDLRSARFGQPVGVACDRDLNVHITDNGGHTLRALSRDGVVSTLAGSAGAPGYQDGTGAAGRFNSPNGIALDSHGNLLVADRGNHRIRRVSPAGEVTTLAGGSPGFLDGTGTGAKFFLPTHVAIDAADNLYVADTFNHCIRKVTPGGEVSTLAGLGTAMGADDGTGTAARFTGPRGIAIDAQGNLYVADTGNCAIRKITSGGAVTTLAGGGYGVEDGTGRAARFKELRAITVDAAGNLVVADLNRIRKVTPAGVVTTLAGSTNLYLSSFPGPLPGTFAGAQGLAMYGEDLLLTTNQGLIILTAPNGR